MNADAPGARMHTIRIIGTMCSRFVCVGISLMRESVYTLAPLSQTQTRDRCLKLSEGFRPMRSYLRLLVAGVVLAIACAAGLMSVMRSLSSYYNHLYVARYELEPLVAFDRLRDNEVSTVTETAFLMFCSPYIICVSTKKGRSGERTVVIRDERTTQGWAQYYVLTPLHQGQN